MKLPLHAQRFRLPLLGVRLQALDARKLPIEGAVASGFIRQLDGVLYLYTCWHVVTGYDPYAIQLGSDLPNRRYLAVDLQAADKRQPGIEVVGGPQQLVLPLYDESAVPGSPLWQQDRQHIPHFALNNINIFLPFWHDVVRIELPSTLAISDMQAIDEDRQFRGSSALVSPGEKCLVIGYPYGYSAFGSKQPTPLVITRFIASDRVEGRHRQFLLDSIAAPGMSGGPVFLERGEDLLLLGVYTGAIYPDHALSRREKVTALGTVADISMHLWDHLPFVLRPSEAVGGES